MPNYAIRRATPVDADQLGRCHIECLAETYATIMPPKFAQQYRDSADEHVADLRANLEKCVADEAAGQVPHRRFWLAEDEDGQMVAIASSGPGKAWWDTDPSRPEPLVGFNFDMLYTLARTHSSGLGQRLLDVCLPDFQEAYLWILRGNPRAEAMYARNGFIEDGLEVPCGDYWFNRPMFRMYRTREMALASRQAQRSGHVDSTPRA